jgi:putative SOS response-associated peptidase YedK
VMTWRRRHAGTIAQLRRGCSSHVELAQKNLRRKPAFRDAWKRGQWCLVITDGYEWKKLCANGKLNNLKQSPWRTTGKWGWPGLWAKWKSPTNGEEVLSCTILTCGSNKVMGQLHDRDVELRSQLQDCHNWLT